MESKANKRLLLVEDETFVRLVSSEFLSEAGYEVVEAESADEALQMLESVGEFHILFSDIRMPGSMNGLQLANLVHERWPDIKILLTSGDTWPSIGEMPDAGQFLAKPYQIDVLHQKIADLFNQ